MANVIKAIQFEEGFSETPYYCSEGYPTFGFGFRLGPKGTPLSYYQIRITRTLATIWLSGLISQAVEQMGKYELIKTAMGVCNDARKAVLISMAYQLGPSKLAQFKKTLTAIASQRWQEAHDEMLESKWAKQTDERAERHAKQMLSGDWSPAYKG